MSVSSTLTSAVMTDMSARVIRVEPSAVLNADDDGLAFADGDVGDEAVEGRAADGLVEGVVVGALAGDGLIEVGALESVWALAWARAATRWSSVAAETS